MNTARISFRVISVVLLLVIAGVCTPSVARAQEGDKALAESLFEAGRSLLKQKQYAAACAKFEESQRQDPSPGTLINLGECYRAQGKTATAWADYKAAAALAINKGRIQQRDLANQRASALEPKLSKVTLRKPAQVPAGLMVKLDDRSVGVASFGVAIAVDPGEHTVQLDAPGYTSAVKKFRVGAKADRVTVELPPLEKAAPGKPATKPATPAAGAGTSLSAKGSASPGGDQATGGGSAKTIGFVLGGVGIVSLGVGAVFGVLASSQASHAKSDSTLCPDKLCTPAGRSEINSAKTKALVSTIGFGVGAAALVAGTVLVLTAGPSSKEHAPGAATASLVPAVGPNGGGVIMSGSF